ncbi:MAG: hypothetical protein GKR86_00995 [Ilumatobacter sp.]|nr:hypothetical protein [Ilumatobacter sp.]
MSEKAGSPNGVPATDQKGLGMIRLLVITSDVRKTLTLTGELGARVQERALVTNPTYGKAELNLAMPMVDAMHVHYGDDFSTLAAEAVCLDIQVTDIKSIIPCGDNFYGMKFDTWRHYDVAPRDYEHLMRCYDMLDRFCKFGNNEPEMQYLRDLHKKERGSAVYKITPKEQLKWLPKKSWQL